MSIHKPDPMAEDELRHELNHIRLIEHVMPIFKRYGISVLVMDEVIAATEAYTTNKINEARIELVNYFMDASYANNGDMDDMVVPLDVVLAHLTPEKALNHRKENS